MTHDQLARALERRLGQPSLVALADAARLDPVFAELIRIAGAGPLSASTGLHRGLPSPLIARPGEALAQVLPPLLAINPGPVYDPVAMEKAYAEQFVRGLAQLLGESRGLIACRDAADLDRHAEDWARIQQLGACTIVGPAALLDRWPHAGLRVDVG